MQLQMNSFTSDIHYHHILLSANEIGHVTSLSTVMWLLLLQMVQITYMSQRHAR